MPSNNTVESLKTDSPRDRPKCPSQRGVGLTEVLKSIDIRQKWVKSSAYCCRADSNKHKNGLIEQSKDLTVSYIL